jgi:hypothetical protein
MSRERLTCTLCTGNLKQIFCRKKYPITCTPPDVVQPFREDIYADQNFSVCTQCSCVQLTNLIDPSILYSSAHNDTFNTPTWLDHHSSFCDFILSNTDFMSILEVGGSGKLFTLMNRPEIQYTCLDISNPVSMVDGVNYVLGNCEIYDYSNHKHIIMSHVFEHLYNPRLFVESLSRGCVENILISIPNMKNLLDINTVNIINNEHTYYIDKTLAVWLFNRYNLVNYVEYKSHSIFMHFSKSNHSIIASPPTRRPEIEDSFKNIFINEHIRFSNIVMKPNSFIVPAGIYGQFTIYYCKPSSIIGFLDNDITKQGHRIYGTPYFTFGFEELLKHSQVTIYLWNGQYTSELIKQIKTYPVQSEIILI